MSIFTTLQYEKFFNPFTCRNRELYFACIVQLIEKSKEVPVLYDQDARSTLILFLENERLEIVAEEGEGEISSTQSASENASSIIRYFRACGWILPKELGRSGDNIAAISSHCRKLIEALNRLFGRDVNSAITNHIFSMYEILRSAQDAESARTIRPYSNILTPLIEHESDLKNELYVLKDSIREIMRAVMRMQETNRFGQFLLRDELLSRFFRDYFFIKRSGLIPGYIARIDRMLHQLRGAGLYEKMVQEYQELYAVDSSAAQETVARQFGELDSFINLEYEKEMAYIDRRINTYYNLYSVRMRMVLSGNANLQYYLNNLLMLMKEMEPDGREQLLRELSRSFRVQSYGYVGTKSFVRRKHTEPSGSSMAIPQTGLSQEERERLTETILKQVPDRYSEERVRAYLDAAPFIGNILTTEQAGIRTRDEAMLFAASILYTGIPDFPYTVSFAEGMTETEAARISNMHIRRIEKE